MKNNETTVSGSNITSIYTTSSIASNLSTGAGATANTTNNDSFHADPINVATGSHVLERNLISVNGAQPINLTTRYDSLLLAQGPMGKGWGHNYETYLEVLGNNDVRIHWTVNRANTFVNDGSNSFSSTEGAIKLDRLVKNGDATYTLTRKDGTIYQFNISGRLTQQTNRIGQALNLTYDGSARLATITEPISGTALAFTYTAGGLVDHVTDPLGRQVKFIYDGSSNLTVITDPNNKAITYSYNADGRVLTGVDAEGNTFFSNIYDAQGRVATQDDALASTTVLTGFSFDETTQPGNVITTVTNRTGAVKVLTHDSKYNLISYKDELNHATSYTYDADGNRLTATDANGNVTTYTNDSRGNVLTVTDPKNRATILTYDASDNLLTVTNSAGKTVTYTYDANNRVASVKDPFNNVTSYTYNANGQVATTTDTKGGVTTYTYSGGLLQSVADPAGNSSSYTYDSASRVISNTNPAGKTSTMEYDNIGNLTKITDPLGRFNTFTYDGRSNRLTATDPKGNVTTYAYNGNSKLVSVTNALNQITSYEYDAEDRPNKVTDARGNSVTITYDAAGRSVSRADALNNSVTTVYDAVGNVTGRTDPYNNTILTMTYDPQSYKPLTIKDALLNTVTYNYDALDRVTSVLDPLNRNRQQSYDDLNRLVSVIDPKNGSGGQAFDANGNRVTQTDANNNQTGFTYDAANRLTAITSAAGGTRNLSYTNGRLSSATNARSQAVSYTYYDDGRVNTVTDPAGTITYTYDTNGNVLTITENAKTISYSYDALNRVSGLVDGDGNTIQYAYDVVGNLTTLTYPDSKTVTYAYDANNRMTTVTDWANRITSYTYDKNGRLLTTTRPDGSVETRTYNVAGQLTQLKDTKADNTTLISKYDFTYDVAGNVTSETSSNGDPEFAMTTQTMTYGADNRLATYNGTAVSYDADGNMTNGPLSASMLVFTYDARNRLTAAAGTTYVYDATNNRVAVTASGQTVKYVINPVASLSQVLMEKDGAGTAKAYYAFGLGLLGRQDATDNSYKVYHFDRRGSTVALTDTAGSVTDTYSYGSYGEALSHLGPGNTSQPFQYNGRDGVMTDANGLYNMRARFFNPTTKRFVNMDSLLGGIYNSQTLNRYAYVNGGPIDSIDPRGLSKDSDLVTLQNVVGDVNSVISKTTDYLGAFTKNLGNGGFIDGRTSLGRQAKSIGNISETLGTVGNGLTIIEGGLKVVNGQGSAVGQGLNVGFTVGLSVAAPTANILGTSASIIDVFANATGIAPGSNISGSMGKLQEAVFDPVAKNILADKGINKAKSDGTIQCITDGNACGMNPVQHFIFVIGNALTAE